MSIPHSAAHTWINTPPKQTEVPNYPYLVDHTYGTLDEVIAFAATHPKGETLQHCFANLERHCKGYQETLDRNGGDPEFPHVKAHIYGDRTPHSFLFHVSNNPGRKRGLVGGIIFHGGEEPTFSVNVEDEEQEGWTMHT